jgi:hypothetical protein
MDFLLLQIIHFLIFTENLFLRIFSSHHIPDQSYFLDDFKPINLSYCKFINEMNHEYFLKYILAIYLRIYLYCHYSDSNFEV